MNSSSEKSHREVCSNSLSTASECQLYFPVEVLAWNMDLEPFEIQERLEPTERADRYVIVPFIGV